MKSVKIGCFGILGLMSSSRFYPLWILVVSSVIFFTHLGSTALWDDDESYYASTAREMYERGDWVVPMFNGRLFPEKPPLMYWMMIAGFEVFGVNELGARFFSAVFGAATALMVFDIGRRLFNSRVGFWAGLITASTIIFTISARAATVDAALTCVTTGALLCFIVLLKRGEGRGVRVQASGFRVQGAGFHDAKNCLAAAGTAAQTEPSSPRPTAHYPLSTAHRPLSTHNPQFEIINSQFSIFNFLLWIILYACLGVAVLGKGPVGFLLPAASIGLFLMILNNRQTETRASERKRTWKERWRGFARFLSPGNFFLSLWAMRPLAGAAVVLTVALSWYILVTQRTDGEWLEQFLTKFNYRPFTQPILGHGGPFWYYVPAVLIGFFPWSIFLGPAAIHVIRRIRSSTPLSRNGRGEDWLPGNPKNIIPQPFLARDGLILLLCWIGVPFVFWSICSTKLPHYLLPAYPALALLTGCFLEDWLAEPARVARGWLRAAWLSAVLAGVGIVVAVPIVAHRLVPGEEWLGAIGLILVLGGGGAWFFTERRQPLRALTAHAVTATVFLTVLFAFAALRIDRHQNARRLIAEIRRGSPGPAALCTYRFFRPSMVFYAGHSVPFYRKPEQLRAALDSAGRMYIITLDKHVAEIERRDPGQFQELTRQRRFLADDQMVVLVRNDTSPAARTAASAASLQGK